MDYIDFATLAVGQLAVLPNCDEVRLWDKLEPVRKQTGGQYRVVEAVGGQMVVRRVK